MENAYTLLGSVLRTNEEIEYILASTPETTWREKWDRKSKVAKRAFREAMFDDLQFKTDKYENSIFHFLFRVEDTPASSSLDFGLYRNGSGPIRGLRCTQRGRSVGLVYEGIVR